MPLVSLIDVDYSVGGPLLLEKVGLTIEPGRLQQIRQERRPDSRYASAQQCAFEVRAAEQLFERHGIPYLETTDTSIEEIASRVLERLAIPRRVRP